MRIKNWSVALFACSIVVAGAAYADQKVDITNVSRNGAAVAGSPPAPIFVKAGDLLKFDATLTCNGPSPACAATDKNPGIGLCLEYALAQAADPTIGDIYGAPGTPAPRNTGEYFGSVPPAPQNAPNCTAGGSSTIAGADRVIITPFTSIGGNFPAAGPLPIKLYDTTFTIPATFAGGTLIGFAASSTATGQTFASNGPVRLCAMPTVTVVKTADGASPATPASFNVVLSSAVPAACGTGGIFPVTLTLGGTAIPTNDYTISGTGVSAVGSTVTVNFPANGAATTVAVNANPNPASTANGTQTVTLTVAAGSGSYGGVGNAASANIVFPLAPSLNTTKVVTTVNGAAATSSTQVTSGDVIVYTITVNNTGAGNGTTNLTDNVPANTTYTGAGQGWSCASGSAAGTACTQSVPVNANSSVTKTYTVTVVNPLSTNVGSIANQVTSSVGTCSACTATNPTPTQINTTKQITTVNGAAATGATQVKAGDVIVYTISVVNTGGNAGTTVLTDIVPANTTYSGTGEGWSCATGSAAGTSCTQSVNAAAGATVSKTYRLTINSPLPANTLTIANSVTTSVGSCSSCTATNPTAPVLDTSKAVATVNGAPATSGTVVQAGDVIIYTITVQNTGPIAATTTLTDVVAANTTYTGTGQGWSCTAPAAAGTSCTQSVTVNSGASVLKQFTVTVVSPLSPNVSTIINTVTSSVGTASAPTATNPTPAAVANPPRIIPTLSPVGLIMLMLLLLGASATFLRRRGR